MCENPNAALVAISGELDVLNMTERADLKYDALSDALYWSDELPSEATDDPERYWCMQQVFRYRMTLILGKPDRELQFVWEEAQRLFPNWPGFLTERCVPNVELERKFRHYHDCAVNAFKAIPD